MKLFFTDTAARDLHEIEAFIAIDSPYRALHFVLQLKQRMLLLQDFPLVGKIVTLHADLRIFSIDDYAIYYRAKESHIEIIRVLHHARDAESLLN